ncbi:ABC transporter substrate-binding protein [Bradyrhizobium centrolobii]|uniref:ABC transporter substrate-binding protein n=1 Tax=Bradyrhizobium centrolobii TaxID=1505087 RepID=A0A176YJ41_9BRAD|nr:ABC transporter substrate-binding protein [Bradyrhizobium centrolobii]
METVHHIFFSPLYIADGLGYFKDQGIRVEYTASQGGDKAMAALLSGEMDIALVGPEAAIYVQGSQSPTKVKMFCGLTTSDGTFLVSRDDKPFDWKDLMGKTILTFRRGTTPALFLDEALRQHGLDPAKDVNLVGNIGIPARIGAFLSGQGDYATFFELDASKLEKEKKGVVVASIGKAVGPIDYTAFMATDAYLAKNPEVARGWTKAIGRALEWMAVSTPAEAAKLLAPFFPGVSLDLIESAVDRQRMSGLWKRTPEIRPEAVEALQKLQVTGGVLKESQKVSYDSVVTRQFFDAGAK